jgi:NAD(P)H-flavin reductase
MTEPKRFSATIRRVWKETPRLTGVALEVPEDVTRAYERAGQYVVLHSQDGKKVYIVIASAPGAPKEIDVLLGEAAVEKLKPIEGGTLDLEAAAGAGFKLDDVKGSDVLLFGTGSAIAALRPLISTIRRNRADYGRVTLYIGVKSADEFAYVKEFEDWVKDRIDIIRGISKPWVQDLFLKDPVPVDRAVAFICGQKDMMESTTAALVGAGMPAERIRKNW